MPTKEAVEFLTSAHYCTSKAGWIAQTVYPQKRYSMIPIVSKREFMQRTAPPAQLTCSKKAPEILFLVVPDGLMAGEWPER
jgi:hypothetical protein